MLAVADPQASYWHYGFQAMYADRRFLFLLTFAFPGGSVSWVLICGYRARRSVVHH